MTVRSETRVPAGEEKTRIPSPVLWYGVLGGVLGWTIHLFFAWSFTEVACMGPGDHLHLQQIAGSMGTTPRLVVDVATGVAWLVAVGALAANVLVHLQLRRHGEDVLARERVHFMVVIGYFLDLMTIAIITGGAIAIAVLRPCT